MLSIDEIKKIALLKGIKNNGNAEKDYLLDIVLLSISRNTKDELVFKGGTCLSKFYKLDRFSEDIDFSLAKEIDIDNLTKKIIRDLYLFGIGAEIKSNKRVHNSVMIALRTKGPLYRGTPQTSSSVRIDINLKSGITNAPKIAKYTSLYPDIPPFSMAIMHEDEIFAEKIRAIMTRTKARDVYDLWFLLEKGIRLDKKLLQDKLKYYNDDWNAKEFSKKLNIIGKIWLPELKSLLDKVPDFNEVKKSIRDKLITKDAD